MKIYDSPLNNDKTAITPHLSPRTFPLLMIFKQEFIGYFPAYKAQDKCAGIT